MNVLIVVPFDEKGSLQTRARLTADILSENGNRIVFIIPKKGNEFSNELVKTKYKIYKIDTFRPLALNVKNINKIINNFKPAIKASIEYINILKKHKIDVVYVIGFPAFHEILLTKIRKIKTIWNLVGNIYPKIVIISFLPLINWSNERVFLSKNLRRYYYGKNTDQIIREPIDFENYNDNKNNHQIRIIGTICKISPIKGLHIIIKSFEELIKEGFVVKLWIIGSIEEGYEEYYKQLITEINEKKLTNKIKLIGKMPHEQIPKILTKMDLFILASSNEGTPLSLIEAMASGLPCIATKVGGVADIIENEVNGILIPFGDVNALTNAIKKILYDQNYALKLGINARITIEKKHSISIYKKLILNLFKQ